MDEERKFLGKRGPLHGIPALLKDNIATIYTEGAAGSRSLISQSLIVVSGMNTTAGSYSLFDFVVPRDAGVVTRLRKAGGIIRTPRSSPASAATSRQAGRVVAGKRQTHTTLEQTLVGRLLDLALLPRLVLLL